MYMARVDLKDGKRFEIPFTCEEGARPYDFVIRFLIVWVWCPRDIFLIELYQDNIYQESYEPIYGWFRKGAEEQK